MSRASVTTFGRGVSFVASGETGTQANEFEAAIKSVTSSTTVGAVFVYDTRNDSDSGAWRKKCAGLSWFDEDLNTATRGGRREFPSVALIVADDDGVTIYDGDDPSLPAWLVANVGGESSSPNKMTALGGGTIGNIGSAFALNGRIYLGGASGTGSQALLVWNFVEDYFGNYGDGAGRGGRAGTIAERNTQVIVDGTFGTIANNTVNDVAAKIVEGSEIGALGLPIPTVAVATDGGVSVIHPNGDVYDIAGTGQTHDDIHDVFFTDDGMVGYSFEASGSVTHPWGVGLRKLPFSDETIGGYNNATNLERYNPIVNGNVSGLTTQATEYNSSNSALNAVTPTGKNGLAIGYGDRLSIVKRNPANMEEGAVAYVTSSYNTGYMLGDIRLAVAAIKNATVTAYDETGNFGDRSVKGNTLTNSGTITCTPVATGAEAYGLSGFDASNYLSRATDTDFDFGTGDFSVMFWIKSTASGTHEDLIARADSSGAEAGDWLISKVASDDFQFYRHNGSSWVGIVTSTVGVDNTWQQVVVCRRGGSVQIYVNGKLSASASSSASLTPSGGSAFSIGRRLDSSHPATSASFSLVRISATTPTPQQVKEMYEAEKPLFRAGAKCLLQSDDASPNAVNDLKYDASTDLLHVFQNGDTVGESLFRGLEVVESRGRKSDGWTYSSASYGAAAGGVSASARALSGGGVIVDLPPFDVRGDTNIADSKSSNDGKIRFTGVTTDATVTTIGQIPVAANEVSNVKVRVNGCKYNASDSSYRLNGEINQSFSRNMTGNVVEESEGMKLVESDAASTDIDLVADTSAQTIQVKVTGISATRMVWKATVEVQRITEKTYER